MSMMLADVQSAALSRVTVKRACADGFLDEGYTKLDVVSLLTVIAGVVAVLALVRLVNLYAGGAVL